MNMTIRALMGACALGALASGALAETTITVATVNNGDMIRMQGLMDAFYAAHPDIKVEWVTLEENVLRQRVTQDVAAKGGEPRVDPFAGAGASGAARRSEFGFEGAPQLILIPDERARGGGRRS